MSDKILNPVPEFGATSKEAFRILRESGAALRQKERVYWAIAALEPVTRARLTKFFSSTEFAMMGRQMTHSSITARVRELIDEGRVRCVGSEKDHESGMEVELLALGRDTRGKPLRAKPQPAMGFPDFQVGPKTRTWVDDDIRTTAYIFSGIGVLVGLLAGYLIWH